MSEHERPPRGVKPRYLHDEDRLMQLIAASGNRVRGLQENALTIRTWLQEALEIVDRYAYHIEHPESGHSDEAPVSKTYTAEIGEAMWKVRVAETHEEWRDASHNLRALLDRQGGEEL